MDCLILRFKIEQFFKQHSCYLNYNLKHFHSEKDVKRVVFINVVCLKFLVSNRRHSLDTFKICLLLLFSRFNIKILAIIPVAYNMKLNGLVPRGRAVREWQRVGCISRRLYVHVIGCWYHSDFSNDDVPDMKKKMLLKGRSQTTVKNCHSIWRKAQQDGTSYNKCVRVPVWGAESKRWSILCDNLNKIQMISGFPISHIL